MKIVLKDKVYVQINDLGPMMNFCEGKPIPACVINQVYGKFFICCDENRYEFMSFDQKEAKPPKTTACIKCGSCANNCPFGIDPTEILKAYRNNDFQALEKSGVELCMECGCCSFVCPAKRPIVQNNKLAKADLKEYKMKEKK